jgi:nitrite reductase (NO-forming)
LGLLALAIVLGVYAHKTYPPHFAMPAWMHSYGPHQEPPWLPLSNVFAFFQDMDKFERIADIGRDPNDVPAPLERQRSELVKISLSVKEVISEVAPEIFVNYWTFNGQVPGPMLRVRQDDTVELSLSNHPTSLHPHSIDLHAVTGPGGGSGATKVAPGETKAFRFKALNPGLFIYHCASLNVGLHETHGQYGLILVEPREGLPKVDKEFYLVQGEIYSAGGLGAKGLTRFDAEAFLDGRPNYVTFNGRVEQEPRMKIRTGERIRLYVGNGGVNLISAFHVIGEIFDTVYPEGAIGSPPLKNVQTTAVLPGGAAIAEFTAEVPSTLVAVDHALARMNKGAWAAIVAEGDPRPDIFQALSPAPSAHSGDQE